MTVRRLVTILVPAKDEEAAIGGTLQALPLATLAAAGFDTEVLVLDGRSSDRTPDIARQHGAVVVPDPVPAARRAGGRPRRGGKGWAVRGAKATVRGDYVVMLDADGTYAADAIPLLLDTLARGDADIVMGQRIVQQGAMTALHRFGNALLSLEASALYGRWVPDLCTGLWGFRGDVLRDLPLRCRGFELEAELFALAARKRLRVRYVPVDFLPRVGDAKLAAPDGLRIGWCLLQSRFANLDRRGDAHAQGAGPPAAAPGALSGGPPA